MIQGPLSIFLMILAVRHCHLTFPYPRQSSSPTALSLKSWAVADCCQQENFKAFKEFVVVPVILRKVLSKDNPKILSHTTVASQGIREAFSVRALSVERDLFRKKTIHQVNCSALTRWPSSFCPSANGVVNKRTGASLTVSPK